MPQEEGHLLPDGGCPWVTGVVDKGGPLYMLRSQQRRVLLLPLREQIVPSLWTSFLLLQNVSYHCFKTVIHWLDKQSEAEGKENDRNPLQTTPYSKQPARWWEALKMSPNIRIQTIGISDKSYGSSERGNNFLKEESLYFIYTGRSRLPTTRWETCRCAPYASALETSLFPHSHLVVLRRLVERATPGLWRLSARLASDKVTINSPTCKKII